MGQRAMRPQIPDAAAAAADVPSIDAVDARQTADVADASSADAQDAAPDARCSTVTYNPPVSYPIGEEWGALVAIGDLTGDGLPELIVTDSPVRYNPSVSFLRNLGARRFASEISYPAGWELRGLAVSDMNGDGKLDVVGSEYTTSSIEIFFNAGSGVLRPHVDYPASGADGGARACWLAVGDLNGDGVPDIALGEPSIETGLDGMIGVLLNRGDGGLGPQASYTTKDSPNNGSWDRGPTAIVTADLNGDGFGDIAVTSEAETVGVYLNNGDGTFAPEVEYVIGPQGATGNLSARLAAGDLNGDGRPDLVVLNYWEPAVGVLLNTGRGAFAAEAAVVSGTALQQQYIHVAVGDMDGDGRQDIVTASADGAMPGISVFHNLGGATFAPPVAYPAPNDNLGPIAIGDLDGDGLPDVAAIASGKAWPPTPQIDVFYSRCH
jgi:hypothetical protein